MGAQRLFIVGNYTPDEQWSMRQFSDLAQAAAESGGWRVTTLIPNDRFGRGRNTQEGLGKYLGYIDKYVLAPASFRRALRRARAEGDAPALVHIADHSNGIYNNCFGKTPVLVTCHDLIAIRRSLGEFPMPRPGRLGRAQQQWILSALKRANHVAFDSDASRRDFLRLTGTQLQSDPVVFPCLAQQLAALPREEALHRLRGAKIPVRGRFIMHHGNASWYKNRDQVISVFLAVRNQRPDVELLCSGGKLTPEQKARLAEAGVAHAVHEPGNVSTAVLQALYSSADVFFFPSWIEGFGWPPVEAQVCGCPVVASTGGSLAEVLGDSALVAAPDEHDTFVKHVLNVLDKPALAAGLRERGFVNVRRFSRELLADGYLRTYEAITQRTAEEPLPVRRHIAIPA
jgi:glycosyltransferase involved in cell wall biosynthesis